MSSSPVASPSGRSTPGSSATLCLRAEDVLTFLWRKLHGKFAGEILNDWKRRWPGARVKHAMKANWIRMYDKHGCVLRVETVINDPYESKSVAGLVAVADGLSVAPCPRVSRISFATPPCRRRPTIAISMPSPSSMILRPPSAPSTASSSPYAMVRAVRRVRSTPRRSPSPREHLLQGFRNRELRRRLFGPCVAHDRWRSAQVSRLLKRLHLRGLLAKIPRSRRWRVTHLGHAVASTAVLLREEHFPTAF
jgi:hypothetical protein